MEFGSLGGLLTADEEVARRLRQIRDEATKPLHEEIQRLQGEIARLSSAKQATATAGRTYRLRADHSVKVEVTSPPCAATTSWQTDGCTLNMEWIIFGFLFEPDVPKEDVTVQAGQ